MPHSESFPDFGFEFLDADYHCLDGHRAASGPTDWSFHVWGWAQQLPPRVACRRLSAAAGLRTARQSLCSQCFRVKGIFMAAGRVGAR